MAFRGKINELMIENVGERNEETTNWNYISNLVNKAAMEVCGVEERKVENPWMVDKEEELEQMRRAINNALNRRNQALERQVGANGVEEVNRARNELMEARKKLRRETTRWEREWWDNILNECEDAAGRGDTGSVYRCLATLGKRGIKSARPTTTITKEVFK